DAPPPGRSGRSYLRPVDPRQHPTRPAAAVPGGPARPSPADQPAAMGAALPPAGPMDDLTANRILPGRPEENHPWPHPTPSSAAAGPAMNDTQLTRRCLPPPGAAGGAGTG